MLPVAVRVAALEGMQGMVVALDDAGGCVASLLAASSYDNTAWYLLLHMCLLDHT
jgi:hypothetical protein